MPPAALLAQADTVPAPNRRMQVTVPSAFYDGRVVQYTPDAIVLDTAQSPTDTVLVTIPRTAVSLARLHTGVSVRPHIASFAVGGAVLTFIAASVALETNGYAWGEETWQRFLTTSGLVVAGATAGGLLGWVLAPPRWVRVDVRPYPTGR